MSKSKKQNKNQTEEEPTVVQPKKQKKEKKTKVPEKTEETPINKEPVKPEQPQEEMCKIDGKCCKCPFKCPCKCLCAHLRLFFIALFIAIGFVLYLIVRDSDKVTFELCKTDAEQCIKNIVEVLTPYMNPYKLIDYLHQKGYVHYSVC